MSLSTMQGDSTTNQGVLNIQQTLNSISVELENRKTQLKYFLRSFYSGIDSSYRKYREELIKNCQLEHYWITIDMADINAFNEILADDIRKNPSKYYPLLDEVATEVADELTSPRPMDMENLPMFQVLLISNAIPVPIHSLKSQLAYTMVKVVGIIKSISAIETTVTTLVIQCQSCKNKISDIKIRALEEYKLPSKCTYGQNCKNNPFSIKNTLCTFTDYQIIKLQEISYLIPNGENPKVIDLYLHGNICNSNWNPGNKLVVTGMYTMNDISYKNKEINEFVGGLKIPFIHVLGISSYEQLTECDPTLQITIQEENVFNELAKSSDVCDKISKIIAPGIFGLDSVKKAITCLLFGGTSRQFDKGVNYRGDIHILLIGDPGTAKSQFLKNMHNIAPISIYTSAKGSSTVGLTASLIPSPDPPGFVIQGGAMVMADNGVVCIDEFDKMRNDDCIAIQEAMENQTISIAKGGIVRTLNSRCSILAAANGTFGKWDDSKGIENINFPPSILSQFDFIFVIKDEDDIDYQSKIKHIMNLHGYGVETESDDNNISLLTLKKYINYCKDNYHPHLSKEAANKLQVYYINLRKDAKKNPSNIPVTIRQLESLIRISQAFAKMQMSSIVNISHVEKAILLFKESFISATSSTTENTVVEESPESLKTMIQFKNEFRKCVQIGYEISVRDFIENFEKKKYDEEFKKKILDDLYQHKEIDYRRHGKMFVRLL